MKNILRLFMLLAIILPISANAKYLYESFDKIEPLLMDKKYDEARILYDKLDRRIKNYMIKHLNVDLIYNKTARWLKSVDEINDFLDKANEQIDSLRVRQGAHQIISQNGIYDSNTILRGGLPRSLPFSPDFINFLSKYRTESFDRFDEVYKKLSQIEKEQKDLKIEAEKEELARKDAEEQEKQRLLKEKRAEEEKRIQEQKLARENAKSERLIVVKKEVAKIDKIATNAGYSGYINDSIIYIIYKTQKQGGLEKYLNKVIGCLEAARCISLQRGLKAVQILDEGVLYAYSDIRSRFYGISIFTNKDPMKIYQEGQVIENRFYAFVGMISYTTVMGAKKTVPAFKIAEIDYKPGLTF